MSAGMVQRWLASGALDLPLPGHGETAQRWNRLAALAETDVVGGRLAEAHVDAVAILAELGGPEPEPGQFWGVWAAESRDAVVTAAPDGHDGRRVLLDGTKVWCSGAGLCSHALVTARLSSGERGLFAVALDEHGVQPLPSSWRNAGMAESDTRSVQFTATPAVAVGSPGEYLSRPGFWHGAAGVAACWLGGARAVAKPLYARASSETADAHALAHLGAVDAALAAAEAMLMSVALEVDADPLNRKGSAELVGTTGPRGGRDRGRRNDQPHSACARAGTAGPGRHPRSLRRRSRDVRSAESRREGSGTAGPARGGVVMTTARTGNSARLAARPLAEGGTPTQTWLDAGLQLPELDLTDVPGGRRGRSTSRRRDAGIRRDSASVGRIRCPSADRLGQ